MERINYNSLKLLEYLDKLNPNNSGIFFSILLHLIILLFAVGLPNFFGPKNIVVPNIIPIEILNISDTTNTKESENKNDLSKKTISKKKKFNSSDNTEIQKQYEIKQNVKTTNDEKSNFEIKEKLNLKVEQKEKIEIKKKEPLENNIKLETLKTDNIKPKLKPKNKVLEPTSNISDVQIEPKIKRETKIEKKEILNNPKTKPKEDFNIASMLKDLRNEKSNNIVEDDEPKEDITQTNENEQTENMVLSISEIDLLRQQLSSCWNAPAGAVINIGDRVTISAKVQQNMRVFENSVRIIDTNISKSNPFYGPITDSAMRTLLNPECTPLKLPKDKYNLWKNLTITFDYSIMKGY